MHHKSLFQAARSYEYIADFASSHSIFSVCKAFLRMLLYHQVIAMESRHAAQVLTGDFGIYYRVLSARDIDPELSILCKRSVS